MSLHLISIHHAEHGLGAVEAATAAVPGLGHRVVASSDAVRGAVVLATCNRVEVCVDADAPTHAVAEVVRAELGETIEQALHTSRKVSHLTRLATTGRSVVSVGLDNKVA